MATMTAAQRRELERQAFLESMESCASRDVIALLSDKWVTLILHALATGPLRRGELARAVAGASPKMLTQTLRRLEERRIVIRTVIPNVPVHVVYDLTALGRSLHGLVVTIADWAAEHFETLGGASTSGA